MSHGLLVQVPVADLPSVYHSENEFDPEWIAKVANVDRERLADIEVFHDDQKCHVYFVPDTDLPENDRAREVTAALFGWHMKYWGDVFIDGLTDDQITEFIRDSAERD